MRSVLGRIAVTVALSLGATGALVAVQAPAFATENTGCTWIPLAQNGVRASCTAGPEQYQAAIVCEAYNHHYSYLRLGPLVQPGSASTVYCYSSAEYRVAYGIVYVTPPPSESA